MQGKDMIGRARTGTGKTLAFGIPIMDRIIRHNDKHGLVSLLNSASLFIYLPERDRIYCNSYIVWCMQTGKESFSHSIGTNTRTCSTG
jgi:hypothetical protein